MKEMAWYAAGPRLYRLDGIEVFPTAEEMALMHNELRELKKWLRRYLGEPKSLKGNK